MAGGNKHYGESDATADALVKSIIDRGIDFAFLQETCKSMTDRLRLKLASHHYDVVFEPTWKKCKRRVTEISPRPPFVRHRIVDGSAFGIGIVARRRHFLWLGTTPFVLPHGGVQETRKLLCLHVEIPRPIVACSTHLTAFAGKKNDKSRREQTEMIARILETATANGDAVLLGGDFNMEPLDRSFDALWDPLYGGTSRGAFIEVDSGPSAEVGAYERDHGASTLGVRPFWDKKIDYIFVRGVGVLNADVGRSKRSDHRPLWAEVLSPANQPVNTGHPWP
jgi:endonuclease/exonuclease/phosphatase family metal-dependent hydrolase